MITISPNPIVAALTQLVSDTLLVVRTNLDSCDELAKPVIQATCLDPDTGRFEKQVSVLSTTYWAGQDTTWKIANRAEFADNPNLKLGVDALLYSLRQRHRVNFIAGPNGTGKQKTTIAAAHLSGKRRVLVLCPKQLTQKWREAIQNGVPEACVYNANTLRGIVNDFQTGVPNAPLYIIVGYNDALVKEDGYTESVSERMRGFFDLLVCDDNPTMKDDSESTAKAVSALGASISQTIGIVSRFEYDEIE